MRQHRITLLVERLYTLDQKLGGNEKSKNPNRPTKEFDQILATLREDIEMIAAKQNDRDAKIKKYGRDQDAIALGVEIREAIKRCDAQIYQMEKTLLRQLTKPKKYDPAETETKVVQLKLAKVALKGTKTREFGVEEEEFKGVQLADLQKGLFQKENSGSYRMELSKEEEEAMERWGLNDQKMDAKLDLIIEGLDQLKYKAVNIGEKIDQTDGQIKKLTIEVDKANQQLSSANAALKKLTQVYRRPNKFVLDIMFVLLLLGLIATIVTTFTKK